MDAPAQGVRIFRATAHPGTQSIRLRVLADCLGVHAYRDGAFRSDVADLLAGSGDLLDPVSAAGESMLALLARECTRTPVAVILDDLQWADEASLAIWYRLARMVDELPLLALATCRPIPQRAVVDSLRRALRRHSSAVVWELKGLDPQTAVAMAGARLSAAVGEKLLEALGQAAGNPLYIREMVDVLAAEGLLHIVDGVAELARPVPPGLPSLNMAIKRSLDFVPESTRAVLRAGAVLGPQFTLEDLSLVLERPVPVLVAGVQEALAAGVLTDDGAGLGFRHRVVQEALRDEVPVPVRARMHACAAKALADAEASWDRVARHLLAVPQAVKGWALEWLASVPASALNSRPAVAADLLDAARAVTAPDDPRRHRFTARLTTVLRLLRRYDDLAVLASDALNARREPPLADEIACNVGLALYKLGRTDDAAPLIALTLDRPDSGGVWCGRARALHAMGQFAEGDSEDGWAGASLTLVHGERIRDAVTIAWSLDTVLRRASDEEALAYLDRALAGLIGDDDPETADVILQLLITRLVYLTRLDRTTQFEADLPRVAALAERANPRWCAMLHAVVSTHSYERGDWDQALRWAEIAAAAGDAEAVLEARGVAARVAARRGNHTLAARHLAAASAANVIDTVRFGPHALVPVRAMLAEAAGLPDVAAAMLAERLSAGERESRHGRREWLPKMVRLALAIGDLESARAAVDTARRDADAWTDTRARLTAQICQAMAEDDPVALLAAAEHLDRVRRLPDLAFALEEAAVRLAQKGDLPGARSAYSRAAAIYADLGAATDLRRIQARLRPHGIRGGTRLIGRRTTKGWEALTPAERAVAEQMIQGEPNQTIAANLHLSRRTVETHVSRILTKVNARNRTDLAREAALRDAAEISDHPSSRRAP
jgi:DNA-binding CsgD family transcriptional regulator